MQRITPTLAALALTLLLAAACPSRGPEELTEPGRPAPDAGLVDAGQAGDAGEPDAGTRDAGLFDAAAPAPDGAIRVASFNVRRFFDTVCDSQACGPGEYEALPTAEHFEQRADQIAAAIRGLNPTAVLLQEVESQAAFDALAARLEGMGAAAFGEIGLPGSVDVGVLARGEIVETRRHREGRVLTRPDGTPTSFAREFLEVHLTIGGAPVVLFTSHFRSKSNDDPGRRLAEAQAAAAIVAATSAERPEALVILGGDLNDVPGSAPLEALELSGELLRVAGELGEEAATYWYDGGHAIDHLFVDTRAAGGYLPGTARVAHAEAGWGLGGSDHAAIVADFALPGTD